MAVRLEEEGEIVSPQYIGARFLVIKNVVSLHIGQSPVNYTTSKFDFSKLTPLIFQYPKVTAIIFNSDIE